MRLPILNETSKSRDVTVSFGGYNHNLTVGDGEFWDTHNLCTDFYPVLSPRRKRLTKYGDAAVKGVTSDKTVVSPSGDAVTSHVCVVVGNKFIRLDGNNTEADFTSLGGLDGNMKTFVRMGTKIVILPDKVYVDVSKVSTSGTQKVFTDFGKTDISVNNNGVGKVIMELCRVDGTECTVSYTSATVPSSPTNGQYWVDTSGTPHTLKQYNAATSSWVTIPTTYVKLRFENGAGKFAAFDRYDGVKLSWSITPTDPDAAAFTGYFTIFDKTDDYIVITGMLDETMVETDGSILTVSSGIPTLDFAFESNNRIWGCRYGLNADGEFVNEIYASKLGSFRNFNSFAGISSDSWTASCGKNGTWTGAIDYNGQPTFFKSDAIYKVYGSYPAQYQLLIAEADGVEMQSDKSLVIVNGILYYHSPRGFMAYDGSLPTKCDYALGDIKYKQVRSGAFGDKYYCSMQGHSTDASGWHVFVYDTALKIWMKEEDEEVEEYCEQDGELWYVDHDKALKKIALKPEQEQTLESAPVKWYAETGDITASYIDHKYVSRMLVRLSLALGSVVRFYIKYDSVGGYEHVFTMDSTSLRSFAVPIRPKRCDHFRLRIEGVGEAKIHSISKTIETGSDER